MSEAIKNAVSSWQFWLQVLGYAVAITLAIASRPSAAEVRDMIADHAVQPKEAAEICEGVLQGPKNLYVSERAVLWSSAEKTDTIVANLSTIQQQLAVLQVTVQSQQSLQPRGRR